MYRGIREVAVALLLVSMGFGVGDPLGWRGGMSVARGEEPAVAVSKVINSQDIEAQFSKGEQKVKVIVNLVEPAEAKAGLDLKDQQSVKTLQAGVSATQEPVLAALAPADVSLRHRFQNQAGFSCEVTQKGLEQLKSDARVASIQPVYALELNLAQGIPLINGMIYRSTYNGAGVSVAICDSGIDCNHPAMGGGGFPNAKVIGGHDFGNSDNDPSPDNPDDLILINSADRGPTAAHGTACAGIAGGNLGSTGDYIGGVAPSAKVYSLKIMNSLGMITDDSVVAAWDWCVTHKDDDAAHPIVVISNSFGGGQFFEACDANKPAHATAANNLVAAGVTVVVASGNAGYCTSIAAPACLSSVVSVGAVYDATLAAKSWCLTANTDMCGRVTDSTCPNGRIRDDNPVADMVTGYSNIASFLTVFAPSHDAYTADIVGPKGGSTGDYFVAFGGTSAATPYTAGTVACIQSAAKARLGSFISPSQIRSILTETGNPVTANRSGLSLTKPRINLGNAIDRALLGYCQTTITTYPYAEGFESGLGAWADSLNDNWNWTRSSGATPTADTGPASAHGGSYYLYTEASGGGSPNQVSVLEGPCFNLATLDKPVLKFWYHMYGSQMGSLVTQVSNVSNPGWVTLWNRNGSIANNWLAAEVSLAGYVGQTIKIRFVGTTGAGELSDMAIDDVSVTNTPPVPSVSCNRAVGSPASPVNSAFVFTNSLAWGATGVDHYRYAWNQQDSYAMTGTEPSWSSGTLSLTASTPGRWFLHLESLNSVGISGGTATFGPYHALNVPVLNDEPNNNPDVCNTISWSTPPAAIEYYAESARDSTFSQIIGNSGWVSGTSYEFCGLPCAKPIWYRVKARTAPPVLTDTIGSAMIRQGTSDLMTIHFFTCDRNSLLTEIKYYMGIDTSQTIQFGVYESGSGSKLDRIHLTTISSGTGTRWYSSGPISVQLVAGKTYGIGTAYSGSASAYFEFTGNKSISWGTKIGHGNGSYPMPSQVSVISESISVYQQLTTIDQTGHVVSGWSNADSSTQGACDHTLTVNIVNGSYGTVTVDPNEMAYYDGTHVTLTPHAKTFYSFQWWRIYDPNYPGDSNHATVRSDNPLTITMDMNYVVDASFGCGSGLGEVLPILVVGMAFCLFLSRYRARTRC